MNTLSEGVLSSSIIVITSFETVNCKTELKYGLKWKTNYQKDKFYVNCHVKKHLPKVKPEPKAPKSDIFKHNFHSIHDTLCTVYCDL